jgi:hypothetical protein
VLENRRSGGCPMALMASRRQRRARAAPILGLALDPPSPWPSALFRQCRESLREGRKTRDALQTSANRNAVKQTAMNRHERRKQRALVPVVDQGEVPPPSYVPLLARA